MYITRFITNMTVRRQRRRATISLTSLSQRQLDDLGLARYDLFAPNSHR